MILLTLGTQLPFDRLVKALDQIAPTLDQPIFGQIGRSTYRPKSFEWAESMDPRVFDEKFRSADLVVSHAGIGTILTAQKHGKPIVLFPREARYGEHRNDHQLATSSQLTGRPGIYIARTPEELEVIIRARPQAASTAADLEQKRTSFVARLAQQIDTLAGGR
ncbi:glycosyltransferase [Brevundimonas sp.]|uniref:glycosyltransferase n=1 Tax=Brevundimonas sp. TaxID=1871086 RepID=UPI0037BFA820